MAKGKGTISSGTPSQLPGLRAGLRAVKTEGKQMARERLADYKLELSGVRAGQANYARQLGRAQKILGRTTSGATSMSKRVTKMSKANARAVERAQSDAVSRYGTALGASASQQFAPARSAVQQGRIIAKETSRSVGAGNRAAKTVAKIAGQGAKAQMGAAKFALAQALQQRTILDNQTLAGLQEDLYKQGLAYESSQLLAEQQHEYDIELAKLNAKLDRKAAEEAAKGQPPGLEGVKSVIDSVGAATPHLQNLFWQKDADGNYLKPAAVAEQYITDNNITDTNEQAFVTAYASNLYKMGAGPTSAGQISGSDPGDAISKAVQQTYSQLYPQWWKKHSSDILDASTASINSNTLGTQPWSPNAVSGGIPENQLSNSDLTVTLRQLGYNEAQINRALAYRASHPAAGVNEVANAAADTSTTSGTSANPRGG